MDNKKLLGKRIKEIRRSKNLTQEQLAEMINIETASLSGIESGRHFPSMPTLEKIASKLNVKIKNLFDYEHLNNIDEMRASIIDNINELQQEQIQFIYKYIETLKP